MHVDNDNCEPCQIDCEKGPDNDIILKDKTSSEMKDKIITNYEGVSTKMVVLDVFET